jgi:hypothetical protein
MSSAPTIPSARLISSEMMSQYRVTSRFNGQASL